MLARKKKTGSNSSVVKPLNRLLRLFRSTADSHASNVSLGSTEQDDACSEDQKMIKDVMLEVEYMKARAVTAMQRRLDFC